MRAGHSDPLILGFCSPWESRGKRKPIDLVKTSPSLHRGPPCVSQGSGCKQQALSPVGFIGRKSGVDIASGEIYWKEIWCSQDQQEAEGTGLKRSRDQGDPDCGPVEQPGQDVGRCCYYGRQPNINPYCSLEFASWLQRQRPS